MATEGWWKRLRGWYSPQPLGDVAPVIPSRDGAAVGAPASTVPMTAAITSVTLDLEHTKPSMAVAAAKPSSVLGASYAPVGGHDELVAADGRIGAHWDPVLAGLDALTHEQRLQRIERINTRVREIGIAHDLFADPTRNLQPWRLDLMPLVMAPAEWAGIEKAVTQRARLMEALLGDVYGAQTTLQRGLIPPQLVYSDPAYLRACQHIAPQSGRIQFFAVDLARRQDGSWRVVDTHLETPAGIGYALANRTVLTHVCGEVFTAAKARRLAPFFEQMQETLARRANRIDPTIALLTPGPHHDDFFSHAYLARYLGHLLVEGDDLRVEGNRVHLKTVSGLQSIDLLVRCVAGAASDAIELDPSGFLGPVGLVQAVRNNPDFIVNALGTALGENRGLGGYLPALCQELLGEDLAIWDVKKWWLGDAAVRREVMGDVDRYFIRRAGEITARPGRAALARDPARLTPAERAALLDEIEFDGASFVAEEKAALGTTPSYGAGGLVPQPFAMRVFACAGPDGFNVMPGGLAMTVNPGASMALSSPEGASRDVWVVSDVAQPPFKSLWRPIFEAAQTQRSPNELPSRAADNLFWLGRYIENADWTFRLLRNCLSRIEEDSGPQQDWDLMRKALNIQLERNNGSHVPVPADLSDARAVAHLARTLLVSTDHPFAVPQLLDNINRIASLTRDRLSLEAWRTLNAFYAGRRWQREWQPASIGDQLDLIDTGLGVVAAFNGLSHENMTRNFGWSFLDMGRRLTRTKNLATLLLAAFGKRIDADDDTGAYLFVLELADSFITYRSRYRLRPMLGPLLELLIVDETNPRSLGFQCAALAAHVDNVPQAARGRERTEVQRIALAMLNDIRLADVGALVESAVDGNRVALTALLNDELSRIPQLTDALTRRYFSVLDDKPKWTRAQSGQLG